MSVPSNTAGLLSKFGQTSFISVSRTLPNGHKLPPKPQNKTSKFFKSRNLKDEENVILEEEGVEDEEENAMKDENQDQTDGPTISGNENPVDDISCNDLNEASSSSELQEQSQLSSNGKDLSELFSKTRRSFDLDENEDKSGSDMSICNSGQSSLNETVIPAVTPRPGQVSIQTPGPPEEQACKERFCLPDQTPGPSNSTFMPSCDTSQLPSFPEMTPQPPQANLSLLTPRNENQSKTPMSSSKKQKAKSNVRVAVRCRPLLKSEVKSAEMSVVDINEDQVIVALTKSFKFDVNLDNNVNQETVYQSCVQPIVDKVLDNYNGSVFAYGQTGTGKTYTMGTNADNVAGRAVCVDNDGVIPRAVQQIFYSGKDLSVKVSFYEILNEQVFDLLNPSKQKVPLAVREIPNLGLFKIAQLTQVEVHNVHDALVYLKQGTDLRTTESTAHNQASSRSHAVFTLLISSENEQGDWITRKLNLVDLAGSEAVGSMNTVGSGIRTQGININKGLLSLGNVIRAVAEKKAHIPYRDSVLTKVLKESLMATSYISMIACISPAKKDMGETINTLRFANKAKQLISKPIPAHLLDSGRMSAVKKRKFGELISETPRPKFNNTIHTPTPSKMRKKNTMVDKGYKRQLNMTIATPDKSANERRFVTSNASRMIEESPDSPTLSNISGISMIKPPAEETSFIRSSESSTRCENNTFSLQDITSVFSPYMRKFKESIIEEIRKNATILPTGSQASESMKTPPRRKNTPRMTSSPIRTPARKNALLVQQDNLEMRLDEDQRDQPLKDVTNQLQPESTKSPMGALKQQSSLEHDIPHYDSPASTAPPKSTDLLPRSPTIEEMERTLGLTGDSPGGLLFCDPVESAAHTTRQPADKKRRESRRSSRRTSMIGSELEASLQFIREATKKRRVSERPTRAAAQGIFYGSPSRRQAQNEQSEATSELKDAPASIPSQQHPLLGNDAFSVEPERQRAHNQSILTLLNTGNLKLLTALPAIGPKTGLIIHGYRSLNGGIKSIQELENINGLGPRFYKKFLGQNLIVLDEDGM